MPDKGVELNILPLKVRYPEYHPPRHYPSLQLFEKVSSSALDITAMPEANYMLNVVIKLRPDQNDPELSDPAKTRYGPSAVEIVAKDIFRRYVHFSDLNDGPRERTVGLVVAQIAKDIKDEHSPARMFEKTLILEADKAPVGERGRETIVQDGGYYEDWEDISNRSGSNGKIMRDSVARSLLNFLQNQVLYDSENRDKARQIIDEVENNGWSKVLNSDNLNNLQTLPAKSIKDDSFDFNNQRLVQDSEKCFVLRDIDLNKDGIDAVTYRVFSSNGEVYSDLPPSILLNMSDDALEKVLREPNSIFTWHKSEDIYKEDGITSHVPLVNLYITNKFPDSNSLLSKHRGNHGRSMGIGLIDLGDRGRVFAIGGSHLMIDGMGQSKNLKAHLYDMPLNSKEKKVEFPAYIINPNIHRITESTNPYLERLGLSDFVIMQKFNNLRLVQYLGEYNKRYIKPKSDALRLQCIGKGFNEREADEITKILTPFLSRSTIVQAVATSGIGRMMNCIPYKEQIYHRMGLAITKSLPDVITNYIKKRLSGKTADFSELLKDDKILREVQNSLDDSRIEASSTRYGLPTLGGIQSLLNDHREIIELGASLAHKGLLRLKHLFGYVSDKVGESGDVFITAQNHQESDMGFYIGLLKDTVTARVNIEYPAYFDTLDMNAELSPEVVKKIASTDVDPVKLEKDIYEVKNIWKGFVSGSSSSKQLNNVQILTMVMKSIDGASDNKIFSDNYYKALRMLVISTIYQNVENLMNTTTELVVTGTP